MKTITFPPGVHLVTLEGNTTPVDFLAAFQYENRNVEHINPTVSPMYELDVSKDCCPVFLLLSRREDVERFIDRLNRLSSQHSATIFVFISNPSEYLYESWQSFTTIITYDKSTNGCIVKKGVWNMPDGPYTIDDPPPSPMVETPMKDPTEAPSPKPAETITTVSTLMKTRGFHQSTIAETLAYALVKGDKKDYICPASHNVQKGDWLVLSTAGLFHTINFHAINHIVWEVSFVSNIPLSRSDQGSVALSLRRIPNARFEKGDCTGPYLEDCIVFSHPSKKKPS